MDQGNTSQSGTHHELRAWQLALDLAADLYQLTRTFPTQERYGLVCQIQRAGVSVASNIAEGAARHSRKEYLQFLYVARGSLAEVQTQLLLSERIGFLTESRGITEKLNETYKTLNGLIRALSARKSRP